MTELNDSNSRLAFIRPFIPFIFNFILRKHKQIEMLKNLVSCSRLRKRTRDEDEDVGEKSFVEFSVDENSDEDYTLLNDKYS